MIDKKIKPVVQGGVDNYLGKQPQVQAPRKWQSSPDKPATELAYITEAEKDLILKANIHGGLEGGPNMGPSGIMSLDSFGDIGGGGASGGDTAAGGGYNTGAGGGGFSGQRGGESDRDFDRRKANERAALQIAERKQAQNLGYKERANIADRTYGPLQKYTGERGFLGNLFRGANKYGYTDTYTSGPKAGQVKPGYGGRIFGGLMGLLTGIPFVGGAIGTAYDYGKGIFGSKPKDMSEFNRLGLGGVKQGTYDFDPNAKINQELTKAQLNAYSRFPTGTPKQFNREFDINEIASLINAAKAPQGIVYNNPVGGLDQFAREMEALEAAKSGQEVSVNELGGTLQDFYTNRNLTGAATKGIPTDANTRFEVIDDDIDFNEGIMGIDVGQDDVAFKNDLIAFAPNSKKDRALKNLYSGYENLGIENPQMIDLMRQDLQENQEKGTPLSLPQNAYSLIG